MVLLSDAKRAVEALSRMVGPKESPHLQTLSEALGELEKRLQAIESAISGSRTEIDELKSGFFSP